MAASVVRKLLNRSAHLLDPDGHPCIKAYLSLLFREQLLQY